MTMPRWILTEELRGKLKAPLGMVIHQGPNLIEEVKRLLDSNPPRIIAIGDATSRTLSKLRVDVRVVDGREMRRPTAIEEPTVRHLFKVRNPPGAIEEEAWNAVKEAIAEGDALVIVDGEEDLLALPAILEAPCKSLVFYGQPHVGIVVVDVDERAKEKAERLLKSMKRGRSKLN